MRCRFRIAFRVGLQISFRLQQRSPMLIGWLLAATIVAAPPGVPLPAHITGSVSDDTGLPLAGVMVDLRGATDIVIETDSKGTFEFGPLPEGEYELDATLPGFVPVHRSLRLA